MAKSKYSFTEAQLREAVWNASSIRQALIYLGVVPEGGNYRVIRNAVEAFDIDTSHFKGQAWNKGRHMGTKTPIEDYLSNKRSITSFRLKARLISAGLKKSTCECCGLSIWMGHPIPLELDHIDSNHTNNSLDNLRVLCPNCHALTANYRGKAKRPRT
jgi:hypothetical protein